jgi:hypothetical protein
MAGAIPDHLGGEAEVESVGIDIYRGKKEYQVYASGENDGWFGYLYRGGGFKPYPGTFSIAGNTLSFTVPWAELGGRGSGTFSTFVEWTQQERYSEDLASTATFGG